MKLYHTGNAEIRKPDIFLGRKNADFGQGFYLTPDVEFAHRWAAADRLRWIRSEKITKPDPGAYRAQQEAYAAALAKAMEEILGDSDG